MSEEPLNHIVYSKNVIEFITVANEYCAFIEKHAKITRKEFIEKAQKMLPLLYLKTSLLPAFEETPAETSDKFVTEVDYNFLLNKISAKLGQYDSYQEVFDEGMQFSEAPLDASIAENLCDIYQDLKDCLMTYRLGNTEIMSDALTECLNNFETYWGQKLVNGLRALHMLVYGTANLDSNSELPREKTSDNNEKTSKNWVSNHFVNHSENPFEED